jgi:hypothetical protein
MAEEDITPSIRVQNCWRHRMRLRSVLKYAMIVGVVCVISGLLVRMARVEYAEKQRAQTKREFLMIGLGLGNWDDCFGCLPFPVRRAQLGGHPEDWYVRNGEGQVLYGWRVEILPDLEGLPYGSWTLVRTQPWNSQASSALFQWYSSFYSYDRSNSPGNALETSDESLPEANALAITGPGTAFGDGSERPKSLKDISPGTILVVESRASGIPWPAPGDLDIRNMPKTINAADAKGISSRHPGGVHVIFADKQVWFISDKVPFETLSRFFTVVDAKKYDREVLLGPYVLDRNP